MGEQIKYEKFDWKETIFVNLLFLIFGGAIVGYVIALMNVIAEIGNSFEQVAGLIFLMFTSLKLIYYLGHPKLVFRNKNTKITTAY